MKNRFRDNKLIQKLVDDLGDWKKPIKIMEVCGSHTMAIGHWGIRKLLPDTIQLISGPGCPVCVTPQSIIDAVLPLKDVVIATFGDLLKVPGKEKTLEMARAEGLDVRIVYSPLEALNMAKEKETILMGIGFETTIPGIGYTLLEAKKKNIKDYSILPSLKVIPPALDALLSDKEISIDGFILPGHVSAIIGSEPYEFISEKYNTGGAICGFEPLDILMGIKMLCDQIEKDQVEIKNEYTRVVKKKGNSQALSVINQVFDVANGFWRGVGEIPNSGLSIKKEYREFDALIKYNIDLSEENNFPSGCQCGEVLKGKIIPSDCALFGKVCTPDSPRGACMVSSEGSCAAYYRYERE